MKKILCLLLAIAAMFCVVSCGEEPTYEPGTKFYTSMTVVLAAKNNAHMHYYDKDGNLTLTEVYAYNLDRERIEKDTPVSETREYKYDDKGNVIKATVNNKAANTQTVTEYTYTDDNLQATYVYTEKSGDNVTKVTYYVYEYDVNGRLTKETCTITTPDDKPLPDALVTDIVKTSVTEFTYENEFYCTFETITTVNLDYNQQEFRTIGHKTYDANGDLVRVEQYTVDFKLQEVSPKDGPKHKEAEFTATKQYFQYEYKYDTTKDYDGDKKADKVLVSVKTYDEWRNLVGSERRMLDDYGNVISFKRFDSTDTLTYQEIYSYVAETAPRK